MPSNVYTGTRDVTATQRAPGGGMDTRLLWNCGCKAHRKAGSLVRLGNFIKCAACAQKGKK